METLSNIWNSLVKPPLNPWLAFLAGMVIGKFFGSSVWGGVLGLASWGLGQIQ